MSVWEKVLCYVVQSVVGIVRGLLLKAENLTKRIGLSTLSSMGLYLGVLIIVYKAEIRHSLGFMRDPESFLLFVLGLFLIMLPMVKIWSHFRLREVKRD